ncbi:esterase-like activity of phytase family protein [Rhodobacter lacus]|uniref:Esterase-like activity of phytase family protein n=1 Tax=Rhodobacter lacus TaxID=1641972 RepID=A0ABW5AB60_9RHOB
MSHRPLRALSLIALIALFLSSATGQEAHGPTVFVQSYVWRNPDKAFGGFSGIELDARGQDMVVLSDRATLWRGRILRDAAGRIASVQTSGPVALHSSEGKRLGGDAGDSEGLAMTPEGRVFVSFERLSRIVFYPIDGGPAVRLPRYEAFRHLPPNDALEALAIGPDRALYTLPEGDVTHVGQTPIWRFKEGVWTQPFMISREGRWKPVGADFGPDGRFYLLERDFRGLFGFASRVRVFTIRGDRISAGAVLLETPPGRHDNLEGIAVWRDQSGAIRLTMISDDNFFPLQRTEIVEYALRR